MFVYYILRTVYNFWEKYYESFLWLSVLTSILALIWANYKMDDQERYIYQLERAVVEQRQIIRQQRIDYLEAFSRGDFLYVDQTNAIFQKKLDQGGRI